MNISTYLTFGGNCREAMTFYQACLGGELSFQTVGESPLSSQLPDQMKHCILHARLTTNKLVLTGSDLVGEQGLLRGNAVSMMLNCASEDDTRAIYEKLSEEGKQSHPLEHTFWGALFGDLTDKFGNHWLLNFQDDR